MLAAAVLGAPAAADAATGFEAGTGRTDVTPPPFDAAADALAFPLCPGFDGPRAFALQEPYLDQNSSGRFEYDSDTYCDANANGRYDGLYLSSGVDHLMKAVHDPIDARALALSDGDHVVVVVSVVAQGIFQNYTEAMRTRAQQLRPGIDDVFVSANHNESSPDTIGIYGAPEDPSGTVGLHSGIDDYYMAFLVEQVAQAAAAAYDDLQPATLKATQVPLPADVGVRLSNNFPTTNDDNTPAAIDPKIGVLQALDSGGDPIATVMSLAAHNQEIGHSGFGDLRYDASSDWPGYFHSKLESLAGGGMAMYLVGDNGSEEDPETIPPVSEADHPECSDGCYAQAQATGEALAAAVAAALPATQPLPFGTISSQRQDFFVPIENNLFKAAAAAGLFGERETYANGVPAGHAGPDLRTEVGALDVGPDLQLLANPGEAFPALMLGSPWGIEDAGCPDRANPPAPDWHARARYRFKVGLANDMIGYMIPAWAYSSSPGFFPTTCVNDADDKDPKGHQHKLETEGLGPTASNAVATQLAQLLDADPDPAASIHPGRFVRSDGSLSHRAQGAVGILFGPPGATALAPGAGTIVALTGTGAFGTRPVDANGEFMDYDGVAQGSSADITTRGMLVKGPGDAVAQRYYVDVYPALAADSLGPALPAVPPLPAAPPPGGRVPPRKPASATRSGQPPLCASARRPRALSASRFARRAARGRAALRGRASARACARALARVEVSLARRVRGRCAYAGRRGRLGAARSCRRARWLRARGTTAWRLRLPRALPAGRYLLRIRAIYGRVGDERRSPQASARLRLRKRSPRL